MKDRGDESGLVKRSEDESSLGIPEWPGVRWSQAPWLPTFFFFFFFVLLLRFLFLYLRLLLLLLFVLLLLLPLLLLLLLIYASDICNDVLMADMCPLLCRLLALLSPLLVCLSLW